MNRNDNKLTIHIVGPVGAGKTALAQALEEFLISQGIGNVRVNDPDLARGARRSSGLLEACMSALAERRVQVDIETIQTRKDGSFPRTV